MGKSIMTWLRSEKKWTQDLKGGDQKVAPRAPWSGTKASTLGHGATTPGLHPWGPWGWLEGHTPEALGAA